MKRSRSLPKKQVLRRVLQADPSLEYFTYVPSTGSHGAPLFIQVHGLSRNTQEQARLLSSYCERYGAVLVAPHFAAEQYQDYQRLGRIGRGKRADVALNSIIAEVASSTGADAAQVHLFGYSGGAQFAHRYTMAHPHRVSRAVFAAAGWYTFPDARKRFPYGIRPTRGLPDVRFDPEEFLCVPIRVIIGSDDTTTGSLRRSARIDRQQGVTRVERARSWVAAMRAAADAYHLEPRVSYEEVRGNGHSFRQFMKRGALGDKVFEAFFGPPRSERPRGDDGANGRDKHTG